MNSVDELGDRMKLYEQQEAGRRFIPLLPILARIDGRSFHNFTRGMEKPYDKRLCHAMIQTMLKLAIETNATVGYTQSDEISLAFIQEDFKSEVFFKGKIQKMTSQLGALATLFFNEEIEKNLPEFKSRRPTFDARVWQVPNLEEASNVFLWREWDASKNSISMAASSYYSPKQLHGKNSKERQEMLFQKGINWNDYPDFSNEGVM